jgi:hypothetical protein
MVSWPKAEEANLTLEEVGERPFALWRLAHADRVERAGTAIK